MNTLVDTILSRTNGETDARPMLSRDADSMYWLSRYIERAEHVARLLRVNTALLTDVGDLTPLLQHQMWASLLGVMRIEVDPPGDASIAQRVRQYLTFDPDCPCSLINCLAHARENARAIRETISSEMWENVNGLFWLIHGDGARAMFDDNPDTFLQQITTGSMLFQGLTDQTLPHDQRWQFARLAKHLERVDVTARVIETRYQILANLNAQLDQPIKNIHWMGVLRSCCSIEAYRRLHTAELDPVRVASFLILQKNFPRSIRYCVERATEAIEGIRRSNGIHTASPAERVLGRLGAQLEYAETAEMLQDGLPHYLQKIQAVAAEASLAVQRSYFLY